MIFPFHYKTVNMDDGGKNYLVYVDETYVGHVDLVAGGWIFYDARDRVQAVATKRDDAVLLGASVD